MRERRRTLIAGAMLLVVAVFYDRPAPLVSIEADLADRAPVTAQTAVDLGLLGTVVLSWTVKRLN